MKITGKIDVFQNKTGYAKGIIVGFKDGKPEAKVFLDVNLPDDIKPAEGQTLTLDVEEGYLNAVLVNSQEPFTKLTISVVKAKIVKVFPEGAKKAKGGKK